MHALLCGCHYFLRITHCLNSYMETSPPCGLLLFFLLFALHEPMVHATSTISVNQSLSGDQKLVSPRGKFALGFFQPAGAALAGNWYIGVWYNTIPVQTPVWVASRVVPVSDPTASTLTIGGDGNMVLFNQFKTAVWSTNVTIHAPPSNATVLASLLDTGNLVLKEYASNTSANVLWQSFDHPTDTWIPGIMIGRNKVTGESRRLISWKNYVNPAPGLFSHELDPNGSNQLLIRWNNSQDYWSTGNWTGEIFTNIPEMSTASKYPPSTVIVVHHIETNQGNYFTFTVNDMTIWRFVMDVSGQVQAWRWAGEIQLWELVAVHPRDKCDVYSVCGAFSRCTENAQQPCSCLKGFSPRDPSSWELGDHTGGCTRDVALQCINEKTDKFYVMNNVRLPDKAHEVAAASIRDCEKACLNNCSCTAYSYNGSCSIWYADLKNLQDNFGEPAASSLYVRSDASELSSKNKRIIRWPIVGIVIGGVATFAFLATVLVFLFKKKRSKGLTGDEVSLIAFKYKDLQHVTKNFSKKLGGGSFGSVFKGSLDDETIVAVKKLEGFRQGEKQFRAEVSTVGAIQHINLIRLLGFCSERAQKLLVYEYMPNGSLDKHLFTSSSDMLSWHTRYQIAIGIAKGLAYLHEKCKDCIIHCDIKPENILLDASFAPKVADFGLAKLVGRDFSKVLTTIRGTIGYLAPEWISGVAITAKVDVYSYGMMLFEIISRKRNIEQGGQSAETFFPLLVARNLLGGGIQTLLDDELAVDVNMKELERACKVACWCVQDDENSRPAMGEIVQILEGLFDVAIPPIPRRLQTIADCTKATFD